jgi:hypothetical protein
MTNDGNAEKPADPQTEIEELDVETLNMVTGGESNMDVYTRHYSNITF